MNQIDELEVAAEAWRAKGWSPDGSTQLAGCWEQDADDLLAIASALREGDEEFATILVLNLDTLVRDQIPRSCYAACGLRAI